MKEPRSRPEAGASLDHRTLLDHPSLTLSDRRAQQRNRLANLIYRQPSPVGVAVYPTAAEAVVFERLRPPERSDLEDVGPSEEMRPSEWSDLSPEERERRNWERANGRAFSESRRYFVSNGLRYMWVLTFTGAGLHGPEGRALCMKAVSTFVRRFRRRFGEMAYWFSPELHPGGHGWHVNFFVPKRLDHADLAPLWSGHATGVEGVLTGTTWVSDKTKDPRVKRLGLSFAQALRLGALYACKYASKDWSPEQVPPGAHRFVCAPGFKPAREVTDAESIEDGIAFAVDRMGAAPILIWRSDEDAEWEGPRVVCLRFEEPTNQERRE